jgi:hypothetical protein
VQLVVARSGVQLTLERLRLCGSLRLPLSRTEVVRLDLQATRRPVQAAHLH